MYYLHKSFIFLSTVWSYLTWKAVLFFSLHKKFVINRYCIRHRKTQSSAFGNPIDLNNGGS